jgi:hypothetical protein
MRVSQQRGAEEHEQLSWRDQNIPAPLRIGREQDKGPVTHIILSLQNGHSGYTTVTHYALLKGHEPCLGSYAFLSAIASLLRRPSAFARLRSNGAAPPELTICSHSQMHQAL